MAEVLIRKLGHGARLSSRDEDILSAAVTGVRDVPAHHLLIEEGDLPEFVHVVLEGFACRYKMLADGSRQIMAWLVPGDFCDLRASILGPMDHSVATLTPSRIGVITRDTAERIALDGVAMTRALWWATLVDESVLREWLVGMGRRPASNRIAHLFCELHARLAAVGLTDDGAMRFPLTQADLADTVGLSSVHVNRVVGWLREAGLATWKDGVLRIEDWTRLSQFAGFEPNYLHLGLTQEGAQRPGRTRAS